jgi:hypothetical protein
MRRTLPFAAAAFAALLLALPSGPAGAQTGSTNPSGFSSASDDIPEDKLDRAAAAIEQVAQLHLKYEQRMRATPPEHRETVAEEANTALKKAVTDNGLTVNEYNSIIQVAQANPQVRDKILQRIRVSTDSSDEQDLNEEERTPNRALD